MAEDDAERLKDMASEAPVIRLVNQIIGRAVESQASDIHIEPFEDRVRIRYRYDGDLQEAETQPARLAPAIVSRLKILAKLDIAERRLPQDGRIRIAVRGQEVVFRIATAPSLHGEIVVMRILDRSSVSFDFAAQGHDQQVIARLRAALAAPNGILLVTGPTGSGKTTTLYTALLSLNAEETKIITVEDPIEYQLPGINQIQVKPQIGLDFATLLRSIVRLDPNIIMVGEIRDLETAEIAARAALTGHLVLSTLHTNSAAAAITRLRDMGMEDYLIAAVLRGVLAQRLVRRLVRRMQNARGNAGGIAHTLRYSRGETIYRSCGCPACRNTGYRGRQAIAEFLTPDAEIERLLFTQGRPERDRARGHRGGHEDHARQPAWRRWRAARRPLRKSSARCGPRNDGAFTYRALGPDGTLQKGMQEARQRRRAGRAVAETRRHGARHRPGRARRRAALPGAGRDGAAPGRADGGDARAGQPAHRRAGH